MLTNEARDYIDHLAGNFLREANYYRATGDDTAAALCDRLADDALATLDADGVLWRAAQSVEAAG
ncbi:hypothetical protein [Methylobacterium sp. 10]|uniref:hypothetical protein n=1 Tax=Methylobacterium sp. 10 TaxID=1101191 RepID=UPI0009E0362C|nr:hypothetical protein [Methylobacterium sp. 10]